MDLDGTLAPIVSRPDLARVPAETLRSIGRAARGWNARIAVVSARPDRDLRKLAPVRSLVRIGQYGLEGPLAPPRSVRMDVRRRCSRLARVLRPLVRSVPGAFLEPKGLTVAVHWRNVEGISARRRLRRSLGGIVRGEARQQRFVPIPGAEVLDFVPRGYDKGRALRALCSRLHAGVVFYFGDSAGDEPAFSALGKGDFPVRVGRSATRARYRVAGIEGVTRFLDAVAASRAQAA